MKAKSSRTAAPVRVKLAPSVVMWSVKVTVEPVKATAPMSVLISSERVIVPVTPPSIQVSCVVP